MPVEREGAEKLKLQGNALFRVGDFDGAAEAFRRAARMTREGQEIPSMTGADASLEVACLCNLALACIKLSHFDAAEQACGQALTKSPSCPKALFRRGQARLAGGNSLDAANDFREVSKLEPANVEVAKMLQMCKECESAATEGSPRSDRAPTVNNSQAEAKRKCREDIHVNHQSVQGDCENGAQSRMPEGAACCSNFRDFWENSAPAGSGKGQELAGVASKVDRPLILASDNPREIDGSNKRDDGEHDNEISSTRDDISMSSFMVSGWLTSAEREIAEHLRKKSEADTASSTSSAQVLSPSKNGRDGKQTERDSTSTLGVDTDKNIGTPRNVSKLLSDLVKDEKTARGVMERGKARSFAQTVAETEWSALHEEESCNRERFRRLARMGVHGTENGNCTRSDSQKTLNPDKGANRDQTKRQCGLAGLEKGEQPERSAEWASLVEEERKLRHAFRSKLAGVGVKARTKKKRRDS